MNRCEVFEKQFEKRYNRKVEVYTETEIKDSKFVTAKIKIISPSGKEYTLTEHFKDNQLTDYVLVSKDNKTRKYRSYIEGELFVADAIGEE